MTELDAGASIGHDEGAMTTVIHPPFPPNYHTERGLKRAECEFFSQHEGTLANLFRRRGCFSK